MDQRENNVSLKPRRKRVVLWFVSIFAAIALPSAGPWLAMWLGPPAYSVDERKLTAGWHRPVSLPGGVTVTTTRYATPSVADGVARQILRGIQTYSTTNTVHATRYSRSDNRGFGLILTLKHVVVHVEGPSREAVDMAVSGLPFLSLHPSSPEHLIYGALEQHLGAIIGCFAVYMVLCTFGMFRGGAWAARISPPAWIAPVPAAEMRARILRINDFDLPFHVREGKRGYLIAEWRLAHARWTTILEKGGLSIAHSVKMKLDPEKRRVKAIDYSKQIRWSMGLPVLSWSFSFFRGIDFGGFEAEAAYGLLHKDEGWRFDRAYRYSYNLNEIKQPLVAAIVAGGWTFQPVITFLPFLGA